MTEFQKSQLRLSIVRLEDKIASYSRTAERVSRQALYDGECGYRESAQFNKGQQFALQYVVEDLQIVLAGLKELTNMLDSSD